jgi:hypothetical protein
MKPKSIQKFFAKSSLFVTQRISQDGVSPIFLLWWDDQDCLHRRAIINNYLFGHTSLFFYYIDKKSPKQFHPKFHLTNNKYPGKKRQLLPLPLPFQSYLFIHAYPPQPRQISIHYFNTKEHLASNWDFILPTPLRKAIIKQTNNKFLLGCAEKETLYIVIGNVNKCHHYRNQYGGLQKTKNNKTNNSSI